MIKIVTEKCKGCGICTQDCPVNGIAIEGKVAVINQNCVSCGICKRVCKFNAIENDGLVLKDYIKCDHCPVRCTVYVDKVGACGRYQNIDNRLLRTRKLVTDVKENKSNNTYQPLISAVGSGTNYPCSRPAPYIVQDNVHGVDVITVVTEAPLSYSGVKVKIDTNTNIGEEGAKVRRGGKIVGMVTTEEYGSKMLTIGGANLLSHGNQGFCVARTIVDLVNGREVKLDVKDGSNIVVRQGKPPIINGILQDKMRVGCGSATVAMFANKLCKVVDEAIVLDFHVIGLLSEHFAGHDVGMKYSGVVPCGTKSTRGRYFGETGDGWGGTNILNPKDAIISVDMNVAKVGYKILVTETTGQNSAMFEIQEDGSVNKIKMSEEVNSVLNDIIGTCEDSSVSVIYTGGTGGSARAGVTSSPKKLTEAVHNNDVSLTIGGAQTYVLPGGGINFMVDVSKMIPDSITWVPTPATVAPVEYTMTKDVFENLGGHKHCVVMKKDIVKE